MPKSLLSVLLLAGSTGGALAQDGFNPSNPPDPSATYRVTVSCDPGESGWVEGEGRYRPGENCYLYTYSYNESYRFSHWTLDGEYYTSEYAFYYEVPAQTSAFVAHYVFSPSNPAEPSGICPHRLYLTTNNPTDCWFNVSSGRKYEPGESVWLEASFASTFCFDGWYADGLLVGTDSYFYYTMPNDDVTLEARISYRPFNPGDPGAAGQDDIDPGTTFKVGDINGDSVVDAKDIKALKAIIAIDDKSNVRADLNEDGAYDVKDLKALKTIISNL